MMLGCKRHTPRCLPAMVLVATLVVTVENVSKHIYFRASNVQGR